jgi:acetyltransferase-like isoleucine patch superfamily enzyme
MMSGWFQRILRRIAYVAPGGFSLRPALHRWRGVRIGKNVWISQYVYIDEIHPEAVSIGDNVSIGIGTSIITHLYWGPVQGNGSAGPVTIESEVFIGPHCVILPGVRLGRGAVLQAGTVVSREVPPAVLIGHQQPTPLAEATVPLTLGHTYNEFVRGLKPLRGKSDFREHK